VDYRYEYDIEKEEYGIAIEEWILGIYLDSEVFCYRIPEAYLRESFEDWLFDEYIGYVTQVKSASISIFYYDTIGLLEHGSDRVARSSVISAGRAHESIDEQENKRYTHNTSIYPRESASCEEKENRNKSQEDIRYGSEFSSLILLKCDIERESYVVINSFFITKISSKIFIF
jgi:hypothetical protein